MFRIFYPRYPYRRYHHYRHYARHHGMGRKLLFGLLVGPWLFRRFMRWGAGGRGGWYDRPRGPRYV
ncbi:MAG TPA: hypothetical protein VF812_15550 [Ktedonobacterales bacterium]